MDISWWRQLGLLCIWSINSNQERLWLRGNPLTAVTKVLHGIMHWNQGWYTFPYCSFFVLFNNTVSEGEEKWTLFFRIKCADAKSETYMKQRDISSLTMVPLKDVNRVKALNSIILNNDEFMRTWALRVHCYDSRHLVSCIERAPFPYPGDSDDGEDISFTEGQVLFVGSLEVILGYTLCASRPWGLRHKLAKRGVASDKSTQINNFKEIFMKFQPENKISKC